MPTKAFEKIAEGLKEAIDVVQGKTSPARWHISPEIDVKAIRKKTGLSQEDFAGSFGFSLDQIRAWEQLRARPLGGVRAYLILIGQDHRSIGQLLNAARERQAA